VVQDVVQEATGTTVIQAHKSSSLLRGGTITLGFQLIGFSLALGWSLLLARGLGPEGRGTYAVVVLIVGVAGIVGSLGIPNANAYLAARGCEIGQLVGNSLAIIGTISVGLFGVLVILVHVEDFSKYLTANDVSLTLLGLAMCSIPLNLIYVCFNNVLLGQDRILEYNLPNLTYHGSFLIGLLVALFWFGWGVYGAVLSLLIATGITAALMLYFVLHAVNGQRIKVQLNGSLMREMLNYGIRGHVGSLAQFFNYRLDTLLVGYFLGPLMVGYYAVAVAIAERLWLVPWITGVLLMPKIAKDPGRASIVTPKVVRLLAILLLAEGLAVGLLSRPLILLLFGQGYESAALPLLYLLPGVVAMGLFSAFAGELAGRGKPELISLASWLSLGLTVALDLVLIPRWSIIGAAVASSVAYAGTTLLIAIAYIKATHLRWYILIPSPSDILTLRNLILRIPRVLKMKCIEL
jgi:O-antigen/teichoic acid export membrane protein